MELSATGMTRMSTPGGFLLPGMPGMAGQSTTLVHILEHGACHRYDCLCKVFPHMKPMKETCTVVAVPFFSHWGLVFFAPSNASNASNASNDA